MSSTLINNKKERIIKIYIMKTKTTFFGISSYKVTGFPILSFVLFALFFLPFGEGWGGACFAQNIGINTSGALPDASALLDIDAAPGNNKGLLIPRVSLISTTDVTTIVTPATSLLVYNTNASMTGGAVGFWYYDGTQWVQALGPTGPTGLTGSQGPI